MKEQEQSIKKLEVIGRGLTPLYQYFKTEESTKTPHLDVIGRGLTPLINYFPREKSKEK